MAEAVHISGREHMREWVSSKRAVYIFDIEMKNIRPANDIGR